MKSEWRRVCTYVPARTSEVGLQVLAEGKGLIQGHTTTGGRARQDRGFVLCSNLYMRLKSVHIFNTNMKNRPQISKLHLNVSDSNTYQQSQKV